MLPFSYKGQLYTELKFETNSKPLLDILKKAVNERGAKSLHQENYRLIFTPPSATIKHHRDLLRATSTVEIEIEDNLGKIQIKYSLYYRYLVFYGIAMPIIFALAILPQSCSQYFFIISLVFIQCILAYTLSIISFKRLLKKAVGQLS